MVKKKITPIWNIYRSESSEPVNWSDHNPNPRFAIFDPEMDSNRALPNSLSDDLVLDRETGLVWSRDANPIGQCSWQDAIASCRKFVLGGRLGWRLPSIEELSSLVDLTQSDLVLPPGHPFINTQYGEEDQRYWSCTKYEGDELATWYVSFGRKTEPHIVGFGSKDMVGYVWPVRGGLAKNS